MALRINEGVGGRIHRGELLYRANVAGIRDHICHGFELIKLIHEFIWPLVTVLMSFSSRLDCNGNHLLQPSGPLLGRDAFAEGGCNRDQAAVSLITAFS